MTGYNFKAFKGAMDIYLKGGYEVAPEIVSGKTVFRVSYAGRRLEIYASENAAREYVDKQLKLKSNNK